MVASGSGVPKKSSKPEEEEGMIERLRIETQRDIQKEKKLAEEKALILSRNAVFHYVMKLGNISKLLWGLNYAAFREWKRSCPSQ